MRSSTDAEPVTGTHDRRARVRATLERRRLPESVSFEAATDSFMQERFIHRVRALFYARMMFLTLGLFILAVPAWSRYFGFQGPTPYIVYFLMLMWSTANFLVVENKRAGRIVTYVTLCLDLMALVVILAKPAQGAGLQSPLLAAQLLFTMLFALLFPRPLAILPPLLALPITIRLDQLLDRSPSAVEILTIAWYFGLNFIVIYVLVYLNQRETSAQRDIVQLQTDLRELAVVEERSRLAREIHDGLGATLSSLIIQAEYLTRLTEDPKMLAEVKELKTSAEESIDELRRSLRMMRQDFDLTSGMRDYVGTWSTKNEATASFTSSGHAPARIPPELQLGLFRVLQECLNNIGKHAKATSVSVALDYSADGLALVVTDNGVGFDMKQPRVGHYGLINLKERARSLDGDVVIESAPGQGTRIYFRAPVRTGAL